MLQPSRDCFVSYLVIIYSLYESVLTFSEVVLEDVIIEYRQTTEDNGKEFLLELHELAVGYLVLIEENIHNDIMSQLILMLCLPKELWFQN